MKKEKAKVLILGTFHMSDHGELFSTKRQTEIEVLVSKLANFKPTRIAVEMVTENNEPLNNKYKKYKLGSYNLEMNEIYQIGFRLGIMLGHEQIYPIDWMGKAEMKYKEVENWAKENQPELLSEIFNDVFFPELLEDKSIINYYIELNDPSFINKLHKIYVHMARIGDSNNYIGLNWLNWWYKRNLIMFANLTRLIHLEEERILLIVGSSHSTILKKFLEESEVCEVIHPQSYLS